MSYLLKCLKCGATIWSRSTEEPRSRHGDDWSDPESHVVTCSGQVVPCEHEEWEVVDEEYEL